MSGLTILGSMRGRLIMMLSVFVMLPVGMASLIALQNYRLVLGQAARDAQTIRSASVRLVGSRIAAVKQALELAAIAPVTRGAETAQCNLFLANILDANRDRYAGLAIFDAAGMLKCGGNLAVTGSWQANEWSTQTRQFGGFKLRLPMAGFSAASGMLGAAYPILIDGRFSGAVVADVRLDWLLTHELTSIGPYAIWLLGADRQPLDLGSSGKSALPTPVAFEKLLADGGQVEPSQSQSGRTTFYTIAGLQGGIQVLIGYDAEQDYIGARGQLLSRLADLGLLVIGGLSIMLLCVERALIEPLRRLTRSIGRWRGGGEFDSGSSPGTPYEIARLSAAFDQAISALIEREGQLKAAMAQQDLLMQEIHHRVKNNLQIVASLLNLQAGRIRQPDAKAEFQAARDRVRTLATLHRHLYAHGELHSINMRSFLVELCGQLFQAHGETEGNRIALQIDAPELQMSSDQAVPLALLVTEIVSNSVKHAFPPPGRGHIVVRLEIDGLRAHLRIEDDGIGMEDASAGEGDTPHGLGLQLIRGFARQLGATLRIQSTPGMSYHLELELRPGSRSHGHEPASGFAAPGDKGREVRLPTNVNARQIGAI